MNRKILTISLIGLSLILSGCAAATGSKGNASPEPTQTFDAELIPGTPPSDALAVAPNVFDNGFEEYTFKVGGGPVWCTINSQEKFVLCEQNEADATYDQPQAPSSCKVSYGYQIKLSENKTAKEPSAQFTCASGLYADPSAAQTLNPGETLTVGKLTCFVNEVTVRCDNKSGNYLVLGPEVWALG